VVTNTAEVGKEKKVLRGGRTNFYLDGKGNNQRETMLARLEGF